MKELYLVGVYKNGEFVKFVYSGRPCTIRVYESIESAKRGIKQKHFGETKILKVGSLEEVE